MASLYAAGQSLRRLGGRFRQAAKGGTSQLRQTAKRGLLGRFGGGIGEKIKGAYHSGVGKALRTGARAVVPGYAALEQTAGKALMGEGPPSVRTIKFKDPYTGEQRQTQEARGRRRATKLVSDVGRMAAGRGLRALAEKFPQRAARLLKGGAGQAAAYAGVEAGGQIAKGLFQRFTDWQRAPQRSLAAQRAFRGTAAGRESLARVQRQQRAARAVTSRARSTPAAVAKAAATRARSARSLQAFQTKFKPAARTISPYRRAGVRQYAGGSTAARDPYRGAARVSTYKPSTSRAALSQRGTTRRTASGSTYVTKSGRGGISYFGTPRRTATSRGRIPVSTASGPARGSYPSRSAYRAPTRSPYANLSPSQSQAVYKRQISAAKATYSGSTRRSSSSSTKRSYSSFRSQVKVSPKRSSNTNWWS